MGIDKGRVQKTILNSSTILSSFGLVVSKMSSEWQEQLLHRVIKAQRALLQFAPRKTVLDVGFSSCSRYTRWMGCRDMAGRVVGVPCHSLCPLPWEVRVHDKP